VTTLAEDRAAGRWPFCYGPIGDPNSTDPFEWAHARMPEGWHVEGQVVHGMWKATYVERGWPPLVARSKEELVELVEAVHLGKVHLDIA
jgi:hypothetical protein